MNGLSKTWDLPCFFSNRGCSLPHVSAGVSTGVSAKAKDAEEFDLCVRPQPLQRAGQTCHQDLCRRECGAACGDPECSPGTKVNV